MIYGEISSYYGLTQGMDFFAKSKGDADTNITDNYQLLIVIK